MNTQSFAELILLIILFADWLACARRIAVEILSRYLEGRYSTAAALKRACIFFVGANIHLYGVYLCFGVWQDRRTTPTRSSIAGFGSDEEYLYFIDRQEQHF
jgi:hypothetical protein